MSEPVILFAVQDYGRRCKAFLVRQNDITPEDLVLLKFRARDATISLSGDGVSMRPELLPPGVHEAAERLFRRVDTPGAVTSVLSSENPLVFWTCMQTFQSWNFDDQHLVLVDHIWLKFVRSPSE